MGAQTCPHKKTTIKREEKNYLIELFLFGEKTGRKADASEVSKTMRKARNADGSLLFQSDEYLTSMQITSFFSPLTAEKSVQVSSSTQISLMKMIVMTCCLQWREKTLKRCVRTPVISEISIQHPITFHTSY